MYIANAATTCRLPSHLNLLFPLEPDRAIANIPAWTSVTCKIMHVLGSALILIPTRNEKPTIHLNMLSAIIINNAVQAPYHHPINEGSLVRKYPLVRHSVSFQIPPLLTTTQYDVSPVWCWSKSSMESLRKPGCRTSQHSTSHSAVVVDATLKIGIAPTAATVKRICSGGTCPSCARRPVLPLRAEAPALADGRGLQALGSSMRRISLGEPLSEACWSLSPPAVGVRRYGAGLAVGVLVPTCGHCGIAENVTGVLHGGRMERDLCCGITLQGSKIAYVSAVRQWLNSYVRQDVILANAYCTASTAVHSLKA